MSTAQIPLTTAIATERRIFEEAARRILALERAIEAAECRNQRLERCLDSQTARADYLLGRKDDLYTLIVRVALCREVFAQLPEDLQEDIRKFGPIPADLVQ